jgi:hypothetical protein
MLSVDSKGQIRHRVKRKIGSAQEVGVDLEKRHTWLIHHKLFDALGHTGIYEICSSLSVISPHGGQHHPASIAMLQRCEDPLTPTAQEENVPLPVAVPV